MTTMYRQGDVLLIRELVLPAGAELVKNERIVERGELTGHAHRLEGMAEIHTRYGTMYIRAGAGAKLVHEEHAAIDLPAGDYRVVRQREFDGEEARFVND